VKSTRSKVVINKRAAEHPLQLAGAQHGRSGGVHIFEAETAVRIGDG
jgi:hypothetical protein